MGNFGENFGANFDIVVTVPDFAPEPQVQQRPSRIIVQPAKPKQKQTHRYEQQDTFRLAIRIEFRNRFLLIAQFTITLFFRVAIALTSADTMEMAITAAQSDRFKVIGASGGRDTFGMAMSASQKENYGYEVINKRREMLRWLASL